MERQRQVHHLVDQAAVGDFQRRRRRQVAGDVEYAAVGQDAPRLVDRHFAEAQERAVQLQLTEAVQRRVEAFKALLHSGLGGACLLLEVLGFDEQTLVPNDRVA
ncbi:hypothetical protein D3C81_1624240 [compost metagenome]